MQESLVLIHDSVIFGKEDMLAEVIFVVVKAFIIFFNVSLCPRQPGSRELGLYLEMDYNPKVRLLVVHFLLLNPTT